MKRIFVMMLLIIVLTPFISAQDLPKKQYKATHISRPPEINGILDDEAWVEGTWDGNFTQNQPFSGRPETQLTVFKIVFDDDNLYVAIKALDTAPDSIVNRLTRRDQESGDLVGIILDSYHDLRTGFLFGVSSAGVKYDQMFTNDGQGEDSSWDPNWWVKTSINKDGWVAEMKIPFSQLRFEKNSGDVWGMDIARILYRKDESTFWQPILRDAPGLVHLFGELTGLEQIKPRKILDVTPYAVARTETFEADPENPFKATGKLSKLNGGVDAKIGITNNMTMDLTINPDFGQVEADPSVVNLSAYETFFNEKRPFFIEGNNITNFGLGIGDGGVGNDNLFYSRRIGRQPQVNPDIQDGWHSNTPTMTSILGAAKLTGKTKDGLSIGIVEAMTDREVTEIDTLEGKKYVTSEPLTNYFVGRVQKDINNGNTLIGGILTSTNRFLDDDVKDYLHKSAITGGIDFTQYFQNKNWMFNMNTAFSYVDGTSKAIARTQQSSSHYYQRPDRSYAVLDTSRTSLSGAGGRMQIMKQNGHWNFMGAALWKTSGFETNDLGYMRQTDQILGVLWAGYHQYEPKGFYRSYNINSDFFGITNFGGDVIGGGYEWNVNFEMKNLWHIYTGGNLSTSTLSPEILRGGPMMKMPGSANVRGGFSSDERKKFSFSASANLNKGYENSSNGLYTELDFTYKPTNYLSLTLSPGYSKSYEDLQYVTETTFENNARYIFGSINQETVSASFRVNLNLSPNLTFQYWGQPFFASGKYKDYKYITDPVASQYTDRFSLYTDQQISVAENPDDGYTIDENTDGYTDYSIGKNDFNYNQFLSNLVIRWEYSPGSSLYLVWSQNRDHYSSAGEMDLSSNAGNLFDKSVNTPHNVFLIKFSYRFGLK